MRNATFKWYEVDFQKLAALPEEGRQIELASAGMTPENIEGAFENADKPVVVIVVCSGDTLTGQVGLWTNGHKTR